MPIFIFDPIQLLVQIPLLDICRLEDLSEDHHHFLLLLFTFRVIRSVDEVLLHEVLLHFENFRECFLGRLHFKLLWRGHALDYIFYFVDCKASLVFQKVGTDSTGCSLRIQWVVGRLDFFAFPKLVFIAETRLSGGLGIRGLLSALLPT